MGTGPVSSGERGLISHNNGGVRTYRTCAAVWTHTHSVWARIVVVSGRRQFRENRPTCLSPIWPSRGATRTVPQLVSEYCVSRLIITSGSYLSYPGAKTGMKTHCALGPYIGNGHWTSLVGGAGSDLPQ